MADLTKKLVNPLPPRDTSRDLWPDLTKDFNNPGVKIVGSGSDFAQKFNDPNVQIPERGYEPWIDYPGGYNAWMKDQADKQAGIGRYDPGLVKAYNDPKSQIVGGQQNDFTKGFNDPNVKIQPKPTAQPYDITALPNYDPTKPFSGLTPEQWTAFAASSSNYQYTPAEIGPGGQMPYSNFINVNGTIYNQQGKGYATPAELAQDLGIRPDQIDWSQIPAGNIPLGTGQGVGGAYSAPNTATAGTPDGGQQTLIDIANSRPDVLNTAKAQGGDPFTAGTAANRWLNDWWNREGPKEYPGTTLTQPSNASQTGNQGVNTGGTGATGASYDPNDPRAVLANALKEQGVLMQKYFDTLKAQPTAADLFKQYSDQLGIGAKGAQQTGLMSQINKTEQTLNDLEKNITSRITELGEGMSEAQRSRQYAVEKKQPMEDYTNLVKAYNQGEVSLSQARTQLGELMKYAQSDQEKAAALAAMPLEYSQKMLSTMMSAAEYQSPAEKLAAKIAEERAMKAEGLGTYKPSTTTSTGDPVSTALGISAKDVAAFNTAFQAQYEKVLAGGYGTDGAREKAGQAMVIKYRKYADAIWKLIYGKPDEGIQAIFPNGYESQIKQSSTSQTDIPQWQYDLGVRPGMTEDQKNTILNQNKTVTDAMNKMEDIFKQYKDAGYTRGDAENEWKKQNSADSIPRAIKNLFDKVYGKGWF